MIQGHSTLLDIVYGVVGVKSNHLLLSNRLLPSSEIACAYELIAHY